MSLGPMMAGGNPKRGQKKANELYQTPYIGTDAITHVWTEVTGKPIPEVIWEPCCGEGLMVRRLEHAGASVYATDLIQYGQHPTGDFLTSDWPLFMEDTCIWTNPPFSKADKFIEHARKTLKASLLVLLLKSTYYHAERRTLKHFSDELLQPSYVLPLTFRLDFEKLGKPAMECSWFIWDSDCIGKRTEFIPIHRAPVGVFDFL